MLRLLSFALFIYIVYRFWQGMRSQQTTQRDTSSEQLPRSIDSVRCSHCGVHLPSSDALRAPGDTQHLYCSDEHAKLGPKFQRRS